jgi:hypothetical protein
MEATNADKCKIWGFHGGDYTSLTDASCADFLIISLRPWRWRRYVPPKRRLTPYLHGATSQKTAFFNADEVGRHHETTTIYDTQSNTCLTHSACSTNSQVSNKAMDD